MQGDAQQPAAMTDEQIIAALVEAGLPVQRVTHAVTRREICTTRGSVEIGKFVAAARALLAAQAQPQVPDGCRSVTAAEDRFLHRAVRESSTFVAAGKLAAPPVPAQAAPTVEAGPWKAANEFLPYHPSASHIRPDYRDGWNACWRAMQTAHPTTAAPAGVPSDTVPVPREPDDALLRAFYDCPPEELRIAWNAMLYIAERRARASSPSGASQEALTADAKDAARFAWYFSDKPKGDWLATYLDGVRTGWTTDQWRAAIDAAMEQQHAQEQEGTKE